MATKYNSKFTGEQIDNSVETVVSNTATDGQVLTANGTGGATWQDVKGTEVVANPSLAGTESDLTGLEVAGTKYKVPSGGGTEVVANPSLAGTESDLTGLEVAGIKYKIPTGGSGGGTKLYVHGIQFPYSDAPSVTLRSLDNNTTESKSLMYMWIISTSDTPITSLEHNVHWSSEWLGAYVGFYISSDEQYNGPVTMTVSGDLTRNNYFSTTFYHPNSNYQFAYFNFAGITITDEVTPL